MNHWIEILEMDLSIGVTQSSGIALPAGIEARLKLQVMNIGFQRALLIVVVNFASAEHDVTDT